MKCRDDTKRRRSAYELERAAAREALAPTAPPIEDDLLRREPLAMLVRRGFRPSLVKPDLPFDPEMPEPEAQRLAKHLEHYAFRLFLRGAILRSEGFSPEEATRFLTARQATVSAETMLALGLAEQLPDGRYRLVHKASTFGPTLEWFVARELRVRLGFETVAGVQLTAKGVGGDLDIVAAAEGTLVALELKSSPPKHLSDEEVAAFLERLRVLRPHVAVFVVDTALRLGDKVIPMLEAALETMKEAAASTRRVEREVWALTPHLYAVNAKPNLISNIGQAIAEGLRALAPDIV